MVSVAPASRRRLTWLASWTGPERKFPLGTTTIPPPPDLAVLMAVWIALVIVVNSSTLAAKEVMRNGRCGIFGKGGSRKAGSIARNGKSSRAAVTESVMVRNRRVFMDLFQRP